MSGSSKVEMSAFPAQCRHGRTSHGYFPDLPGGPTAARRAPADRPGDLVVARGAQPAAAAAGCSPAAGSVIAKQLPTPGSDSTVSVPSTLCSTRCRAIERPSPVPREGSLVGNGSAKLLGLATAG